jgi:phage baseplate assembly protein W
MTGGRYRAWRFLHPDIDAPQAVAGLTFSPTGGIEMVEELASVRQAVFLLLSTRPGERVMRPDYGCELYKVVFSPNDDTTAGLAIHYVQQALQRWEPRIQIQRLDARRNEDAPTQLDIVLEYRLKATQRDDHVLFPVSLSGGPA